MDFFKNPIGIWFRWYLHTLKFYIRNKNKSVKIGYQAYVINVKIGRFNTFYENSLVVNSSTGNYVYVGPGSQIKNVIVGSFCSIGQGVRVGLGMHPTNFVSTFPAFFSVRKQCQVTFVNSNLFEEIGSVSIGNDVWIGSNAIVMDNVCIGHGAIVAAGAVVTKDVPPYAIVGGVPAKIIKYRFSDEEIAELIALKWWDKDDNWLKSNANLFDDPNKLLNEKPSIRS